jgi:hypothetical protein
MSGLRIDRTRAVSKATFIASHVVVPYSSISRTGAAGLRLKSFSFRALTNSEKGRDLIATPFSWHPFPAALVVYVVSFCPLHGVEQGAYVVV